jgi:hypothetical protein
MDASRSYYLACRQHDFAEIDAARCQANATNIHYVIPANDNSPTAVRLTQALARFNDCVTCGRQFLLQRFDIMQVSQIFGGSVVLLKRTISLATDWRFMRLRLLLRWVAKDDAQIASQAQIHGR